MITRRIVSVAEWIPVGVPELEPAADQVVRSNANRLVVAGPGAGKTELLAQRASFLLDTGGCPSPRRILAISFKRDAAKNLESRVQVRCGDRADRFDSLTLDAFAKRIVDRFLPAIPNDWRPHTRYQVRLTGIPVSEARTWLQYAVVPVGFPRPGVHAWTDAEVRDTMDKVTHGTELPYDDPGDALLRRTWGLQWWREQLRVTPGVPSLTFPMLNRLAAFILRKNPKILAALRATYTHVFMDEFQDTTASQWDLVHSALKGSHLVTTAVGDGKQRIMGWAGAKTDIFERYEADFKALPVELVRNYRSVPELVDVQHVIALALEQASAKPVAASSNAGPGVCAIWEYRTPEQEAADIATFIADEIAAGSSDPRDFCVLVRQQAGAMIEVLSAALAAKGVKLRDESALQDLRAEPITTVVLASLTLATRNRAPAAWEQMVSEIAGLSGLDPESDSTEVERMVSVHKMLVVEHLASGRSLLELPRRLLELLGEERYRATYRQYSNGDFLPSVLSDLGKALQASHASVGDAAWVVDDLSGVGVVPAMTIHKSKGLEFGTVIFLGLEDSQWWNFRAQPEEEKRAFFVAFSRAIRRVIFTWSDERTKWSRRERQKRENVDALHAILRQAGVPTVDRRTS